MVSSRDAKRHVNNLTSACNSLLGSLIYWKQREPGQKHLRWPAGQFAEAAATDIATHPAALELRRMQVISEVGVENNTTTIILMPSDFVALAKTINDKLTIQKKA